MYINAQRAAPVTATLGLIPDGVAGIRATLKYMSQFVKDGKKSMTVRNQALSLTGHLAQKDWAGEAIALHAFVRDEIRYVMDTTDVELVQTPDATLSIGAGDCDDKSTLLCALLESIGHPTRFVAVGSEPNLFEHVYVETKIGGNWIVCETTEPVPIGWQPPLQFRVARMEHHN